MSPSTQPGVNTGHFGLLLLGMSGWRRGNELLVPALGSRVEIVTGCGELGLWFGNVAGCSFAELWLFSEMWFWRERCVYRFD